MLLFIPHSKKVPEGCYKPTWQLPAAFLSPNCRWREAMPEAGQLTEDRLMLFSTFDDLSGFPMTNRWVSFSNFLQALFMHRVTDSSKQTQFCKYALSRCHSDSCQRCWLFSNSCRGTLLFPELGRLVLALHKRSLPYEQKWDHTGWSWQADESAIIHAVRYYQQQFASGLVPEGTHVSNLHKGPECDIPLDFGDLECFHHRIESATSFTTLHFVLKGHRLALKSFLLFFHQIGSWW